MIFSDFVNVLKSMAEEQLSEKYQLEFYRLGFTILADSESKSVKTRLLKKLWTEVTALNERNRRGE